MDEILRAIKKDCRLAMNGVVSTSMREHGLDYKLNFGLINQQIKFISEKYGPSASLGERLWGETTRELKILATLIYPADEFKEETADLWVANIPNQEIREQICINLLQHLPYATKAALNWSQSANLEIRTTGYWLMSRLFLTKKFKGEIKVSSLSQHIWEDILSRELFTRNASSLVLKHIIRQSKEEAEIILQHLLPYKDGENAIKQEAYRGAAFEYELMYD